MSQTPGKEVDRVPQGRDRFGLTLVHSNCNQACFLGHPAESKVTIFVARFAPLRPVPDLAQGKKKKSHLHSQLVHVTPRIRQLCSALFAIQPAVYSFTIDKYRRESKTEKTAGEKFRRKEASCSYSHWSGGVPTWSNPFAISASAV